MNNQTSLTKSNMHQRLVMIYICFKFHRIRFKSDLVIINYVDFKSIQEL